MVGESDADDAESVDSLLPWFGSSARARAILAELESEGFCVLRGVLSADECARELARLWDFVETASPRVRRDDPRSWYPATAGGSTRPT